MLDRNWMCLLSDQREAGASNRHIVLNEQPTHVETLVMVWAEAKDITFYIGTIMRSAQSG